MLEHLYVIKTQDFDGTIGEYEDCSLDRIKETLELLKQDAEIKIAELYEYGSCELQLIEAYDAEIENILKGGKN